MGTIRQKIGKRGAVWEIDYYDQNGRRHRETIHTSKSEAVAALKAREGDVVRERFQLPTEKPRISFKDFFKEWCENHLKVHNTPQTYSSTKYRAEKHLVPAFEKFFLDEIAKRDIDRMLAEKAKGLSTASINRLIALLSKMFNDAVRWGYLAESPVKHIQKLHEEPQGFTFLESNEVTKLLEHAGLLYGLILGGLMTGMRMGELLGLKWSQVNLKRGTIVLYRTKSKKPRIVPVHPDLGGYLEQAHKSTKGDFVFAQPTGEPWKDVHRAWHSALKRAGIKRKVRFHDLRHTFASHFMMSGGNSLHLQKILGHSDLKLTLRYAHLAPDFMSEDIKKLSFGRYLVAKTAGGRRLPQAPFGRSPQPIEKTVQAAPRHRCAPRGSIHAPAGAGKRAPLFVFRPLSPRTPAGLPCFPEAHKKPVRTFRNSQPWREEGGCPDAWGWWGWGSWARLSRRTCSRRASRSRGSTSTAAAWRS
ncbi:MAG: tyrosine-type recombinase/integrase [Candidatus Tectomicrobia bacterium]|nr:tyrosine-type recombinase/integrase [Candidatus Tectomicrobia bacterium]